MLNGAGEHGVCFLRSGRLAAQKSLQSRLKREALEDPLWNQTNDKHDHAPETGQMNHVTATSLRGFDALGNRLRSGPERTLGKGRGHRGIDESGLDGEHVHSASVQTVAQPTEKETDRPFGRTIDIVALTPAIAGDGGDHTDRSGTPGFEHVRKHRDQRQRARAVRRELMKHRFSGRLAGILIWERAMGDQNEINSTERLVGGGQDHFMASEIVGIHDERRDRFSPPLPQVLSDGFQMGFVSGDQADPVTIFGIKSRGRFRNGGGRADDEDLFHEVISVTRRQKVELKAGSRSRSSSRHWG